MAGTLDEERKRAIDEFLNKSKEAQLDLIKILNGMKYAEQLAETVVSQDLLEKVQEPETYLSVLLKKSKFDQWPLSVKWSIEALIVVTGIVGLLVLVPWDKALKLDLFPTSQEVTLAEVRKASKPESEVAQHVEANEVPQFVDEPSGKSTGVNKSGSKDKDKDKSKTKVAANSPPAVAAPGVLAKTTMSVVITPPETGVVAGAPEKTTQASEPPATATFAGSLYRGVLKVTNAEAISPKITEKIVNLGGRKAGEVDLGWKKGETAYYYHFTLPEAKYAELETYLSEYSSAKISKEKHPRTMPDGIIRLIIQVEEKKP
ncbi:MAG: hypothetical protein JNM39_00845 [Bdellovibrionaceae bacterium]|nr:hypothetical protein [Pseudobdellovibrionaceae bacterium]